jgi:hypothetical protein
VTQGIVADGLKFVFNCYTRGEDAELVVRPNIVGDLANMKRKMAVGPDGKLFSACAPPAREMFDANTPVPALDFEAEDNTRMGGAFTLSADDAFESAGTYSNEAEYRLQFGCSIGGLPASVTANYRGAGLAREFGFGNKPVMPPQADAFSAFMMLLVAGMRPRVMGALHAQATYANVLAGVPCAVLRFACFECPATDAYAAIGLEVTAAQAVEALAALPPDGPNPLESSECLSYIIARQHPQARIALLGAEGARFFVLPKPTRVRAVLSDGALGVTRLLAAARAEPAEKQVAALRAAVAAPDAEAFYHPTLMLLVARERPASDRAGLAAIEEAARLCNMRPTKRKMLDAAEPPAKTETKTEKTETKPETKPEPAAAT